MTTEDSRNGDGRLVRFDHGAETFSSGGGTGGYFLGATVHNGNILLADLRNDAIQRFTPNGVALAPFANFSAPTFLESDLAGNVYTTHFSLGPSIATKFNPAGAVVQSYVVQAPILSGIDADASGNVYMATYDDGTIEKFTAGGVFLNSTVVGGYIDDMAIDESGERLFAAREFGGGIGIKVFDISGPAPVFLHDIATPVSANVVGIHYAAESGNVLITDFGPGSGDPRGLEYSPTGILLREYRAANTAVAWDITTFVPEPSSAALLLIASWLAFSARRRAARR